MLPYELVNVIVPRASINAKVKTARTGDLADIFNNTSHGSISLEDILDFSYEVAIGDEKISMEEFEKLSATNDGLIKYKDKYVLIDKDESNKLFEQIAKANHTKLTRLELLHASMSGQLDQYEFDYDEAYANVIKDFNKLSYLLFYIKR